MDEELSSLEARHRKEKKELQAQIQALKKVAKNDKTKKKDLVVEIAKLESDLETRHKEELENVDKNTELSNDVEIAIDDLNLKDCGAEVTKTKVSKAQKRRDKKSQIEKERIELIKLQEKENKNGPRNLELQSINSKLGNKSLKLFLIPSDGDCLYKAVAHQLLVKKELSVTVQDLRQKTAEYIRNNKDDFIPFMSNTDTHEMLSDEEFEDYCNKIVATKVWGGQLEIRALSNSLKCPISVIQDSGPASIDQGSEYEGDPLVITYHRHMYSLGEHYNSTETRDPVLDN